MRPRYECERCHVHKYLCEFTSGRDGRDFSACRSCKTHMAAEGTTPKRRQKFYLCVSCHEHKHSRAFIAGSTTCMACDGGRPRKPITGISQALNAWLRSA